MKRTETQTQSHVLGTAPSLQPVTPPIRGSWNLVETVERIKDFRSTEVDDIPPLINNSGFEYCAKSFAAKQNSI
jgi:hypothetical protein